MGWGADMRIVDVQSAWASIYRPGEDPTVSAFFVITCAAGIESKENRT